MAEQTTRERLQPSLLDRLTDQQPDRQVESRDQRVLSTQRLRECVLRDMSWLLNTVNLESAEDLEDFPEVARSVLNYGLPDLAGHTASSVEVMELEQSLKQAILRFEPRLLGHSLRVSLGVNPGHMQHNSMVFDIEADLWAQPVSLRLDLKTEIDLELGDARVYDTADRR